MTDAPEEPQAPVMRCPIGDCETTFPYPANDEVRAALEPVLVEHTNSHSPQEFMNTIAGLQAMLIQAEQRISELESAFRGATLLMQQAGLAPGGPPGVAQPPSGLILPPGAQQALQVVQERKHGDVVPGRGTLVGKKITDPMVRKDLGLDKGKDDRG